VDGAIDPAMTFDQLYELVKLEKSATKPKLTTAITQLQRYGDRVSREQADLTDKVTALTQVWEGQAGPMFRDEITSNFTQVEDMVKKLNPAQRAMTDLVAAIDKAVDEFDQIQKDRHLAPPNMNDLAMGSKTSDKFHDPKALKDYADQLAQRARDSINRLTNQYGIATQAVGGVTTAKWNGRQSAEGDSPGPANPSRTDMNATSPADKKSANPNNAANPNKMANQQQDPSQQQPGNQTGSPTNSPSSTMASAAPTSADTPTSADSGIPTDPGTPTLMGTPTTDVPTLTVPPDNGSTPVIPASNLSPLQLPPVLPVNTANMVRPAGPLSAQTSAQRSMPGEVGRQPTLSAPALAASASEASKQPGGYPIYPPGGGMGGVGAKQNGAAIKPGVAQSAGGPTVGPPGAAGKRKPKNVGIPPELLGRAGDQRSERPATPVPRRRGKPKPAPSDDVLDEELWTPATTGR
jgi:uncharacterized protein YukE